MSRSSAGGRAGGATVATTGPACRFVDPELFFACGRGAEAGQVMDNGARVAAAKGVCRCCPVRQACLRQAVADGEGDGIWGGLTPMERLVLRRQSSALLALGEGAVRLVEGLLAAGLPPTERDRPGVVLLLLNHGWTEREISAALHLPDATVRAARATAWRVLDYCRALGLALPGWVTRRAGQG
ncbi:WhiB family transcriptional regulator [Kitasatospora sp. NBC_01302]|uniref:WhiB family transcriptional regulator n=1 Tax=Kitasatospora sp. NBC_01302 TaxID=2903575 RepID=UPI002E118763|nr:WhiB family transcriptional regulator [Kitasatospora sp. NBC_01302]